MAALAALLATLALVPPAHAVLVRTRTGRSVSFQPTVIRARAARALQMLAPAPPASRATLPKTSTRSSIASGTTSVSTTAGPYQPCSTSESACLAYFGGPVMRTTTLTPVFWNPSGGLSYPAGYKSEVEQFFTDLAADSGKQSNFFSVLTQYSDKSGAISYAVTSNPGLEDVDALPTGSLDQCTSPWSASRPCVTDEGLAVELEALIAKDGLATGLGHEYVVFFPPGMDSCFGPGGAGNAECSGTGYCGYHTTLKPLTSTAVQYANEPDNGDPEFGVGCTSDASLTAADLTLDTASHEISESVTDPETLTDLSWYDEHTASTAIGTVEYAEIGDICSWEFKQGDPALAWANTASDPSSSDQTINGHPYLLQTEWDNAHSTCSISGEAAAAAAAAAAGPTASFAQTSSGIALTGEAVSFDASASTGTITSYEWNWGDGSPVQSGASTTAEHTYSSTEGALTKTFTVTLTVTDSKGETATISKAVEVEDRPPTATFAAPSGALALSPVAFDGSSSSDPDGTIASYRWEFGDGSESNEAQPSHTYTKAGDYEVTLTVTDDAGQSASSTEELTVGDVPPVASFSVLTASPTAESPVSFDASTSSDPDGTISSYHWEFGDGNSATGASPSHTYATAGTYTVKLTVTDDAGQGESASHQVTVAAAPAPSASFLYSPERSVSTGEPVSFDASASSGPVAITSYEWNWGDGSATFTSASPTATHSYAMSDGLAKKAFTVTLKITDAHNHTAMTTKTMEVLDRKPSASFSSPSGTLEGSAVTFDGSSSSDPDGTISSYHWEFGDGNSATGASPSHTYATAGTYTVKLTVTDDAGQSESVSHQVTVGAQVDLVTVDNSGSSLGTQSSGPTSPTAGSTPTPHSAAPAPPSNVIRVVSSKPNKRNGSVVLKLSVPGAGTLSLRGAATRARKKHGSRAAVRAEQLDVSGRQIVTVQVIPVGATRAALAHGHKLSVKVLIMFSPTGGTPRTIERSVVLRLGSRRKRR